MTGSLDEVQIADIQKESKRFKELVKRKESILASIEEQGKLTPELRKRIEDTYQITELEDIYFALQKKAQNPRFRRQRKGSGAIGPGDLFTKE